MTYPHIIFSQHHQPQNQGSTDLVRLQLAILVEVKEIEDFLRTEVELLIKFLLTFRDHDLTLHQTLQLSKAHNHTALLI